MKMPWKLYVFLLMFLTSPAVTVGAIIDFEDGLDPAFTYSEVGVYYGVRQYGSEGGYEKLAEATPGGYVAYNPDMESPSDFYWNGSGTFDLISFMIAGAWGSQTLTIQGLNNGSLLESASLDVSPDPITFMPNWFGLDQLRILIDPNGYIDTVDGGRGQHWALDQIVINESVATVPEPGTLSILLLGLLGLSFRRNRKLV